MKVTVKCRELRQRKRGPDRLSCGNLSHSYNYKPSHCQHYCCEQSYLDIILKQWGHSTLEKTGRSSSTSRNLRASVGEK